MLKAVKNAYNIKEKIRVNSGVYLYFHEMWKLLKLTYLCVIFYFIIFDHYNLYIFIFCGLKVFHLLRNYIAKRPSQSKYLFKEMAEEMKNGTAKIKGGKMGEKKVFGH